MADSQSTTAPKLSTGMVGAIHELRVCADLLSRGVHVFRAVSPSCPCDMIADYQGRLIRVEVTQGVRGRSGRVLFPPHKAERFDMIAVVLFDGTIFYTPDLFGGNAMPVVSVEQPSIAGDIRQALRRAGHAASREIYPGNSKKAVNSFGFLVDVNDIGFFVRHIPTPDTQPVELMAKLESYKATLVGSGFDALLRRDKYGESHVVIPFS